MTLDTIARPPSLVEKVCQSLVAIARRGKLIYHEAFGALDPASGTPMVRA
jgi:hypothetical protein